MLSYQDSLTQNSIWLIKQNKPSLIARDLEQFGVAKEISHNILLARGVYKWFSVRRQIIKLKNSWKTIVTQTISNLVQAKQNKDQYQIAYLRGYLQAYQECRKEIRALCHSPRWQAPDFDKEAQSHLQKISTQ